MEIVDPKLPLHPNPNSNPRQLLKKGTCLDERDHTCNMARGRVPEFLVTNAREDRDKGEDEDTVKVPLCTDREPKTVKKGRKESEEFERQGLGEIPKMNDNSERNHQERR